MKLFQLLATISIDGCLLDFTQESHWALMAALYSFGEYIDLAGSKTGERDIINYDECYPLIEARKGNIDQIKQMLNNGQIREMVIYTVPILAGNGNKLFDNISSPTIWRIAPNNTSSISNITRTTYVAIDEE